MTSLNQNIENRVTDSLNLPDSPRQKMLGSFVVGSEHLRYADPNAGEEEVRAARENFVLHGSFNDLDEALACARRERGKVTCIAIVKGTALLLHLSDADLDHYESGSARSLPPASSFLEAGHAAHR